MNDKKIHVCMLYFCIFINKYFMWYISYILLYIQYFLFCPYFSLISVEYEKKPFSICYLSDEKKNF